MPSTVTPLALNMAAVVRYEVSRETGGVARGCGLAAGLLQGHTRAVEVRAFETLECLFDEPAQFRGDATRGDVNALAFTCTFHDILALIQGHLFVFRKTKKRSNTKLKVDAPTIETTPEHCLGVSNRSTGHVPHAVRVAV
jgi:hypothetical protein